MRPADGQQKTPSLTAWHENFSTKYKESLGIRCQVFETITLITVSLT